MVVSESFFITNDHLNIQVESGIEVKLLVSTLVLVNGHLNTDKIISNIRLYHQILSRCDKASTERYLRLTLDNLNALSASLCNFIGHQRPYAKCNLHFKIT